jgi:hypothetical protein
VDRRQIIWRRGENELRVDLEAPSDARGEAMLKLYNTLWREPEPD